MGENDERVEFQQAYNVSRETMESLVLYESCLNKWNQAINLVSKQSLTNLWHRHFRDSAQLWDLVPKKATSLLDMGSGAGFPGIILAIMAKDRRSPLEIRLVESDQRKCSFLQHVCRSIGLETRVFADRIEKLPAQMVDVVTARALAPMDQLLSYAERHRTEQGVLIIPKGNTAQSDLKEARKNWIFNVQITPSQTNSDSVIYTIKEFRRARLE